MTDRVSPRDLPAHCTENSTKPAIRPTIRAAGLGKRYRHYPSAAARLGEWLSLGRAENHQDIWALRDVGFTVASGEAVAVVGENGAGKSTLLGLLLGTTTPSEGGAEIQGEVTGLLELGLGLKPDFTGRRNAELALLMRGVAAGRIAGQGLLDAIQDFAELGEAFDWPLRSYSTGMQMRLAFAAATALRPDVLIVDEALAVGDAAFQYKCFQRIKEFKEKGTTLFFVSHDLASLRLLCDRGLLLSDGRLLEDGPVAAVLDRYNALLAERHGAGVVQQSQAHPLPEEADAAEPETARETAPETAPEAAPAQAEKPPPKHRSGDGRVRLTGWHLTDRQGRETGLYTSGDAARLSVALTAREAVQDLALGLLLRNVHGVEVFGANTAQRGIALGPLAAGESLDVAFEITLLLGRGRYFLTLAAHAGDSHLAGNYDWLDNALEIEVLPDPKALGIGVAALPLRIAVS